MTPLAITAYTLTTALGALVTTTLNVYVLVVLRPLLPTL